MTQIYDTCIIIPCFNEEKHFLVEEYTSFLKKEKDVLLCFVNDGSSDKTEAVINQLKNQFPNNVEVVSYKKNQGKAYAVKKGVEHCNVASFDYKYIAYLDADLAVSLEECYNMKQYLIEDISFAFGSRMQRIGAQISRKRFRFLVGRIIATIISVILGIKVYDTQCGCKIFTKKMAQEAFSKPFISKWLFDVEIFYRILNKHGKKKALTKMIEVPLLKWVDRGDSKVKMSYFFKLWFDLLRIKNKYSKQETLETGSNFYTDKKLYGFAFLIAIVFYAIIYGLQTVNPSNDSWLMSVYHDWGQHYLGWLFYRDGPWSFPLGNMDNYFYPIGTNVGFTDSIPIVAFFAKIFSFLLPENFQYFGLWMLLSFILNALYTVKILKLFNVNNFIILLSVVIMVTNPVLIFRGMHPALTAQWLILASFYYYLIPTNKNTAKTINKKQIYLFLLSTLIHPYLAVIVAGFNLILPIKHYFYDKSISKQKVVIYPFVAYFLGLGLWMLFGLISLREETELVVNNAYGIYTFNFNGFFNSMGYYSRFLPALDELAPNTQYEGFSYLGLGVIIICFTAFISLFFKQKKNLKKQKYLLPFIGLNFLLLLFAASNKMSFGNSVFMHYPIPSIIDKLGGIFRASGRFVWPFYYMILFFGIIIFSKIRINTKLKSVFFLLVVALQIYDIQNLLFSKKLEKGQYHTKVSDSKWISIFKNFDEIITYPPFDNNLVYKMDYQDLMYLAVKAHKPISNGYVARENVKASYKYKQLTKENITLGKIGRQTLFIANKNRLNDFKTLIFKNLVSIKELDDFMFVYSKEHKIDSLFGKQKDSLVTALKVLTKQLEKSKPKVLINSQLISNDSLKINIEKLDLKNNIIQSTGWAFVKNIETQSKDSIYVSLSSNDSTYLFKTDKMLRNDVTSYFKEKNHDYSGYETVFYLDNLLRGNYRVGIVIKTTTGKMYFKKSDKDIKLE